MLHRPLPLLFPALLAVSPTLAVQGYELLSPPGSSRTAFVAANPLDADHVLVDAEIAGAQTLWETLDGGATWVAVNEPFPPETFVRGGFTAGGQLVLLSPNDELVPGEERAFARTGSTFEALALPPVATPQLGPTSLQDYRLFPDDPNKRVALTEEVYGIAQLESTTRVHLSTDAGLHWSVVFSVDSYVLGTDNRIEIRELFATSMGGGMTLGSSSSTKLGFETGVFTSDDLGATWALEWYGLDSGIDHARSRVNPSIRYATVVDDELSGASPVRRREGTGPWVEVGEAGTFLKVACGQLDPSLVVRFYREPTSTTFRIDVSRDGGASWEFLTSPNAGEAFFGDLRVAGEDSALFFQVTSGFEFVGVGRVSLGRPSVTPGCDGVPNSTGRPGVLAASGTDEVAPNRFRLFARDLPAGSCFLPLVSATPGFVVNPGGSEGTLCLGGPIGRLYGSAGFATPWGEGTSQVDLTQLAQPTSTVAVQAGDTWYYQVWYRDCTGAGASNFTGSLAVTYL